MPVTQGTAPAVEMSDIPNKVRLLEEEIGYTSKLIEELAKTLSSVLSDKSKGDDGVGMPTCSTELGEQLGRCVMNIRTNNRTLDQIIQNIEL